ncbi:MAG: class I SAM-dependent methyltransferase [Rhodobacteraceae bacterium]|nr:class I SAM-dependent methyltransferase [Alphaproteobacteria bacterium]NNK65792.1 class I SAM-dependent methyltransferase [Paracoccaceae bacterium]
MTPTRLDLALGDGLAVLPDGPVAVFGARANSDLSSLRGRDVHVVQRFWPDVAALRAAGWEAGPQVPEQVAASVVFLPRSKAEARAVIAQAVAVSRGPVIVDGQKTDGIESVLRDARRVADVSGVLSKHHGKLFSIAPGGDFASWADPGDLHPAPGFVTRVGVFSADKVDRGSAVLADLLPARLPARVADFGAGWGFLSRAILERDGVTSLDVIEADHRALECARRNITDDRARFHWADVAGFVPETRLDAVITNPPFHTSRAADPALGAGFIAAAARVLAPFGQLWLVANRHLPYEKTLTAAFTELREVRNDPAFKVYHASRPRRPRG